MILACYSGGCGSGGQFDSGGCGSGGWSGGWFWQVILAGGFGWGQSGGGSGE